MSELELTDEKIQEIKLKSWLQIQSEANRLKDESDKRISDATQQVKELQEQAKDWQDKIDSLENVFKNDYGQRVSVLEIREAKVIKDESTNDGQKRLLDQKEIDLEARESDLLKSNKAILAANEAVLEDNKKVLADLSLTQIKINQESHFNDQFMQDAKDKMTKATALMDQADAQMAEIASIREEIRKVTIDAKKNLDESSAMVEVIKQRQSNIESLNKDLDAKNLANAQQLERIKEGMKELEQEKSDIQKMLDQQNANLETIQKVNEQNKTLQIANRAKEIELNQKDQEIKERLKNVQVLEANVQN